MTSPSRLFLASRIALIVTAMSFAIRGDIMVALGTQFALNNEQMGWIAGTAFWGFTLAMILGGPLCDAIGMGRLLGVAFVGHLGGVLLTIFAQGFWSLFAGTLAIGIANGCVEAACNPLVATLYANEKTKMLNRFHVWFPGGIVIGGLVAYALSSAGAGWQIKMATMLIPLAIYGALFFRARFPQTERVASGVPASAMLRACVQPLFLLIVACMVMTASTELGPNQWIPSILTTSAGVSGILVLVWINGLMAVGRQFAGPVVHRLSPTGMLLFSAIFSALGLYLLSIATGWATFGAATIFAIGVCYFWPTMLGFTAERMPKSGALGLAIVGGAGMLAVNFVLPAMGHIYDTAGGAAALRTVGILPVVLIAVFGVIFLLDRARGGYRMEHLDTRAVADDLEALLPKQEHIQYYMKIGGGILLLIGILAAIFGAIRLNSASSQLVSMFAGPDTVAFGSIAIGVVIAIAGIVLLALSPPKT